MSKPRDVNRELNEYLRELYLPAIRDCFEEKARQAERETLSYECYLLELVERECQQRRAHRIARLLQASKLPLEKTMENFDLKRLPVKAARQTCVRLVQDLLRAKKELRLSRAIKKLAYYEALVIDDIGYVQQSREEMEVLFTLLAERHERGSVLLTSNWMAKRYPQLPFERFADDAIVHCRTEAEAQEVRAAIAARLQECGLELHPEKTKVVYCKDDDRRRTYPNEKFDFLGYTFRPRRSKNRKGKFFINFSPAVSDKAVKAIRAEIRSWNLHLRSDKSIEDLSRMFNPIIRGWLQYYGRFYRSALYPPMRQLDRSLARWARAEIQEAARPFAQGDTLGRAYLETRSEVVGALADGSAAWLHGGSRMS